ncbi:winged helix-turn-helix domain-containing protein [Methanosarcina horonobensis]|uniref:winged helix-turn-helix domain-containing protein n=1 Tax=Methanosarcina horonobensis TaxID=418008 RepID=UPI000B045804|nr:helix-turn-helix domain-containing protein [Methanosarcina horonobensis]
MKMKKIKAYANELPAELRRAIDALNSDIGLAVFFVLFKYGEMSFSQIMSELDIPSNYSSKLTYHIKKLQKGSLVKNEYIKKENVDSYSFYDITEFGEGIINNLMNAIQVPQSSNYLIQTLDENSTTSPMTRIMLNLDSNDSKFNVDCAAASDSVIKVLLNQSEATMMAN